MGRGLLGQLEVVAVGDIVPADNLAYLLKYDLVQGRFRSGVESKKSAPDHEKERRSGGIFRLPS